MNICRYDRHKGDVIGWCEAEDIRIDQQRHEYGVEDEEASVYDCLEDET